MKKRRIFVYILTAIFWSAFPPAYQMAMQQRGRFAIGGEWCLLVMPFVIAEFVFTLTDLKKEEEK